MPARPPRLKQRREFQRVAAKGQRAARPGLVLQALPAPGQPLRVGFTTTKKLGNAVTRNRARRRLREAARLLLGDGRTAGFNLVLIGRDATATRDFETLLGDLRGALRQAGVSPAQRVAEPVR
ncbi:ribonuclease P protein component [Falsiroseomonas bella]|uniref:Ribonuclease P protein component n=1 Tax=Falsiroseomonas bella TaxID=2184016 RepID=A0A317FFB6_9PROT|nr:ribonuclease P protein component [Falsiroseomonas bella]PWS37475.1 ribonuclease P protein component [Falsiroseomonas bella]